MSDDFFNESQYLESSNSSSKVWIITTIAIFILIFVCSIFFTHSIQTLPNPKVLECKTNIENLGHALLTYANKHNDIIPGVEIDGKPYWQLIQNNENDTSDISKKSKIKCYSDTSDDPTSYILNESLSGKSLDSIPVSEYSKTALIYERPTGKYHRWAFYLDGIVRQYQK